MFRITFDYMYYVLFLYKIILVIAESQYHFTFAYKLNL